MRNGKQHGFTYLSLVILVAIIGLASAATIKLGAILQRSAAERELLAIGAEYADALESYAKATPPGQSPLPPSFKELLRDTRFPTVRRHLRRVYVDPLTGKAEWGIVYASQAQGGVQNPPGAPLAPGASGVRGAPDASVRADGFGARAASGLAGAAGTPGGPGSSNAPSQGGMGPSPGGGAPLSTLSAGMARGGAASTGQPSQQGGTAGIVAFYSLSDARPVKVGNFPARFQGFENRAKISDWKFARAEGGAPQPAAQARQPGQAVPAEAPSEPQAAPPSLPAQPPDTPEAPEAPPADAQPQRHGDDAPPEEPPQDAQPDKNKVD